MIRTIKKQSLVLGLLLSTNSILVDAKIDHNMDISFNKKSLECLAKNIYYEAKGEPEEGMVAVGIVTLNRVKHSKYPKSICNVVHQKTSTCQFSWTCKKKIKQPTDDDLHWKKSLLIANKLSNNEYLHWQKKYSNSLHFHAIYINPNWRKERIARIGNHIFYN